MASIGHIAVGLAAARAYDPERPPRWPAMVAWSALSLLPDIDVVGFLRGVPYGAPWGHRGATHSLTLAIAGGVAVGVRGSLVQASGAAHGRVRGGRRSRVTACSTR